MTESTGAVERGVVLLDLGRAAEAERHFRDALATDPSNASLLVYLAQSLSAQERYAEAAEAARSALTEAPDHLGALLVLSSALGGLRDFDPALDAVRRALQIAPEFAHAHRLQGALLIGQERPDEALGPLERARTLDPEDADTVALIAAALFNALRFPEAEQVVAEALELDPDNAEAHRIRGLLSLRRGGGRDAVDAHRTALRLDPTDPDYREGLATAMKSRNPLYGQLLRLDYWRAGLPSGARWAVLLAPYFATRILRPFEEHLWARLLLVLVVVLVLVTWTLEPIMNAVLLCSSYARNLLPRATKLATGAFLAYAAASIAAVIAGLTMPSNAALLLGFGLGAWGMAAGQAHLVYGRRRKLVGGLHIVGVVLAVTTSAAVLLDASVWEPLMLPFILIGIAMIWITAIPQAGLRTT